MASVVKVGDSYSISLGRQDEVWEGIVLESCGDNDGAWYCITCDLSPNNNIQAIRHKDHKLVWNCFEHGIEVIGDSEAP